MATTTAMEYRTPATSRPGRTRALSVGGAIVAAVAVWVVAVPLLGLHLIIRFGSGAPQTIAVGFVVGATLIASLAAWGLLALLERRTARARSIWTIVAVAVLIVSLALPFSAGTTTTSKVVLALMHVAVAAVLIPGLRAGSSSRLLSSRSSATRS
jgi:peptidoglycan/LPS O-acetylase OafA/YrhL